MSEAASLLPVLLTVDVAAATAAAADAYQEVMRYWARWMATGEPLMLTWRSLLPSIWLPILI